MAHMLTHDTLCDCNCYRRQLTLCVPHHLVTLCIPSKKLSRKHFFNRCECSVVRSCRSSTTYSFTFDAPGSQAFDATFGETSCMTLTATIHALPVCIRPCIRHDTSSFLARLAKHALRARAKVAEIEHAALRDARVRRCLLEYRHVFCLRVDAHIRQ
jgi:hypothetical protein